MAVTITCAPTLTAAASTCRSSGSGSTKLSMRGSYPSTRQSGLHQTCARNPDEQVAQGVAVQGTGVVHHDEGHSVRSQLLVQPRQLVHHLLAGEVVATHVVHQRVEPDAPMSADEPVFDLAAFEESDQVRA